MAKKRSMKENCAMNMLSMRAERLLNGILMSAAAAPGPRSLAVTPTPGPTPSRRGLPSLREPA
jgi:hypothetical protein